jgi:hypothetical protein
MGSRAYGPPSDYYIPTNVLDITISSPTAKSPATGPLMPQQQDQDQQFNNLAAQQLQSELNAYIANLPPQRLVSSLDQASKPVHSPPTQKRASVRPVQSPPPHRNDGTAVSHTSDSSLGGGRGGEVRIQESDPSPKPHSNILISANNTTKRRLTAVASTLQTQGLNPARALLIASCELETCIHPQPLQNPSPNPNTQPSKTEFDFHADYVAFDESDVKDDEHKEDIQRGVEREVFARLPKRLRYGDKSVRTGAGRGR